MEKKRRFSLWYFVVATLIILAIQAVLFAPHVENLPYSDLKVLVHAGKVANLSLGPHVITGTLKKEGLEGLLPREKLGGRDAPWRAFGNVTDGLCRERRDVG